MSDLPSTSFAPLPVMNKTSIRIKCVIPVAMPRVTDKVLEIFKTIIVEKNKQFKLNYNVKSISTPIQVAGTVEFICEVEPKMDRYIVCNLSRIFFAYISQQGFRADMTPLLSFSSPLFFSDSCIPAHTNVAVQSLYFGSWVNAGTIGVTWTIEFYNPSTQKFPRERRFRDGEIVKNKMKVAFLHDEGSISIKFVTLEEKRRERGKMQEAEYTVKFLYNAIRRIMVQIDDLLVDNKRKTRFTFHFELSCPPQIHSFVNVDGKSAQQRFGDGHRLEHIGRGWGPEGGKTQVPHRRAVAESSIVSLEFDENLNTSYLFEILSRIRVRSGISVEFVDLDLMQLHWGMFREISPYVEHYLTENERGFSTSPLQILLNWAAPNDPPKRNKEGQEYNNVCAKQFRLRYAIEALLSRGAKVKYQLLLDPHHWINFLQIVCKGYKRNPERTLTVLERLLNRVDDMSFPPESFFRILMEEYKIYDSEQTMKEVHMEIGYRVKDLEKEGYYKVRKIVITPTRTVYIAPETIMANRMLRKFYPTKTEMIRVTFRDDDTLPLRQMTVGENMTRKTVGEALEKGIVVGGRRFRFLGSSNSQMRDNGCYFIYDDAPFDEESKIPKPSEKVTEMRKLMGRLEELGNVAKFMARMGQCFTQSKMVNTGLPTGTASFTFEASGGNRKENEGDAYTFSDGVGQISLEFMKKISKDLNLKHHPSVVQFRHRGFKGVLALHYLLDDINQLRRKFGLIKEEEIIVAEEKKVVYIPPADESDESRKLLNVRFRHSQKKFDTAPTEDFEIVKVSCPTPVSLNKPFINILDQVSEMQSLDLHSRLCERVEELLHRQLKMMAETLVKEKSCRDKLKELPRRISIDGLSRNLGFTLATEPFFRSLIKACARFQIKKQLNKEQIQIPLDLGRSMFGVVDESGLLQYGQIFVQYHVNTNDRTPRATAAKIIHTGPTLITKNPCISAGDVRMFEAVDIPALRHLVDVVVFPMHGPRPHPDEMAGSDLDGDEYSVIWDPKLFLLRNEEAMKFPKGISMARKVNTDTLDKDLRDFFIHYVLQDSVGQIATSHLTNSDLWGLKSTVAEQVAAKYSQAVDFPKTAIDNEIVPPQRALRKPDFMQSNRDPVYASSRLVGKLYREISNVDQMFALSQERDQQENVVIDDMIDVDGWEIYREEALKRMTVYNNAFKAIMERYGIATEAELLTGYNLNIRNSISDREADDMSFFNTTEVIETQVTQIIRLQREKFFEDFGGVRLLTKVAADRPNVPDDTNDVFEREVISASPKMLRKAVAYYRVTYEYVSNQRDTSTRFLSFPWVVYDVLAQVRAAKIAGNQSIIAGLDPVNEMISTQVREYAEKNQQLFQEKIASWTGQDGRGNGLEALKRYLNYYEGLAEMAFFFVRWAQHANITIRHFEETHIVILLIQFCIGVYDEMESVIIPIPPDTVPLSPRVCITEVGQVVVSFLQWLSSRSFKKLKSLTFDKPDLGMEGCFMRGEWMPLHLSAMKSFYDLIFSLRIDLPSEEEELIDPPQIIREMTPFVIELPVGAHCPTVATWIRHQTDAQEVELRRMETFEKTRVVVSATGTIHSLLKIRQLLILPLDIRTSDNAKEMSDNFPEYIYKRIERGYKQISGIVEL